MLMDIDEYSSKLLLVITHDTRNHVFLMDIDSFYGKIDLIQDSHGRLIVTYLYISQYANQLISLCTSMWCMTCSSIRNAGNKAESNHQTKLSLSPASQLTDHSWLFKQSYVHKNGCSNKAIFTKMIVQTKLCSQRWLFKQSYLSPID